MTMTVVVVAVRVSMQMLGGGVVSVPPLPSAILHVQLVSERAAQNICVLNAFIRSVSHVHNFRPHSSGLGSGTNLTCDFPLSVRQSFVMCIDFYADVHPDSVNDGADVDAGVDYIAGAAGEGGRNTENSKAFQGSEPEIDWSVTYVCGFNPFYKLELIL